MIFIGYPWRDISSPTNAPLQASLLDALVHRCTYPASFTSPSDGSGGWDDVFDVEAEDFRRFRLVYAREAFAFLSRPPPPANPGADRQRARADPLG